MASPKAKGSRAERRVAAMLGGRRNVLSGAAGGADVVFPPGSHWADWAVEVKARKRPSWSVVLEGLEQAEASARGTRLRPLVVVVPDCAAPIVCVRLDDLRTWVDALVELGGAHRVRALIRQARRVLDAIEEAL